MLVTLDVQSRPPVTESRGRSRWQEELDPVLAPISAYDSLVGVVAMAVFKSVQPFAEGSMTRRHFFNAFIGLRLAEAAGTVATGPPVLAARTRNVVVLIDGTYVSGLLGEKVAGGLFAVDCRFDGVEGLLGVFRLDELLDPKTLLPLAVHGDSQTITKPTRGEIDGVGEEVANAT